MKRWVALAVAFLLATIAASAWVQMRAHAELEEEEYDPYAEPFGMIY